MRSKLLQSIAPDLRSELPEHLRELEALTDEQWRRLCDDYPRIARIAASELRKREIDAQLVELKVGRDVALAVTALAVLIAKGQANPRTKDDPELIAADLAALEPKASLKRLREFVDYITTHLSPALHEIDDDQWYRSGVLPTLDAFETTVEVRVKLARRFMNGDDVDAYQPTVVGKIPIASVRLLTDDGESFSFQCDRETLGLLLNRLRATLKEIDVLEGTSS